MSQQTQQPLNNTFLRSLALQLQGYSRRIVSPLNLDTNQGLQSFVQQANDKIQMENDLLTTLSLRMLQFVHLVMDSVKNYDDSINEVVQDNEEKKVNLQNMSQAVNHLQTKVSIYQDQLQKLKMETNLLVDRCEKAQIENFRYIRDLGELESMIERERSTVCRLIAEKDILLIQIKQFKNNISELTQQNELTKKHLEHNITQKDKVQAQNYALKQEIQRLNQTNEQMKKELESYLQLSKTRQSLYSDEKPLKNDQTTKQIVQIDQMEVMACPRRRYDLIKLEDDLPFNEPFQCLDWVSSLSNNSKYSSQPQKEGGLSMDPYLAHFILTSQSVKIKEDCEQLLNIDVKPYYKQIVQKRIPMHLWDQWIRNKLRQLIKKMKEDNNSDCEDEY